MFSIEQKITLLKLARQAIAAHFEPLRPELPTDPEFEQKAGLFVSLHIGENLRGCIGYIKGYKPLAQSVVEMAQAAAFRDPRFAPLGKAEMDKVNIEISVLSELILMDNGEEPVIGRDGLYIEHPYGSGLLLPQVPVEWKWNASTFLKEVCRKAGLHNSAYLDAKSRLYRFTAEVFSEADTF